MPQVACSERSQSGAEGGVAPGGSASSPSEEHGAGGATGHAYALVTHVWSDQGPTGYVALMESLDGGDVSLGSAREFPGYTSAGAVDGSLLVSPSADDLTIQRYHITDDLSWEKTGTLSFANEGAEAVGFFRQYLGERGSAYLDVDVTGRVVWDPSTLELRGSGSETDLPLRRAGLDLFANFNRANFVAKREILRPFSYHDQDWFHWSADSPIVVYDATTHDLKSVVHAPCPGLDTMTHDEDRNIYLGTWEYSALYPLMGVGAAPCVARLLPDSTLDDSWNTDLTAMTDGRHIVNFRYIGGGKAIAAVFHAEEYGPNYDFPGLVERVDDFWEMAGNFHRLWLFDLVERSASPMDGIEEFEFINPWFAHAVLNDRIFLFLSDGTTVNQATTSVYELDDQRRAKRRFGVPGGVIQWIQVR
jgi:hypothetical protein